MCYGSCIPQQELLREVPGYKTGPGRPGKLEEHKRVATGETHLGSSSSTRPAAVNRRLE